MELRAAFTALFAKDLRGHQVEQRVEGCDNPYLPIRTLDRLEIGVLETGAPRVLLWQDGFAPFIEIDDLEIDATASALMLKDTSEGRTFTIPL